LLHRSELLTASHDVAGFDSGQPALDAWLRDSAAQAGAMHTGRTFVWLDGEARVVAYFTLAAHLVARAQLPTKIARGSSDRIPAILLARLALDRSLHGRRLGTELLWDALNRAVAANRQAAARIDVVDAIDDNAAGFYVHHGFTVIPGSHDRLVQKMSNIEAALA
jgi:GNAT superfamily N-acetyltransferase